MKCKTLHISSMLQFFWQYQIHYRTSILIACKLAVLIFLWMYFRSIIICVKIYTTSMYCILPVASKHLWTVSSGRCCESKPILLWCESQLPTVVSSRSAAIQFWTNSRAQTQPSSSPLTAVYVVDLFICYSLEHLWPDPLLVGLNKR